MQSLRTILAVALLLCMATFAAMVDVDPDNTNPVYHCKK